MSTCISRAGEYSEHQTEAGNYICDLCGVIDEEGIFAELDALRAKVSRVEAKLADWVKRAAEVEPVTGRQVISVGHIDRTIRAALAGDDA